MAKWFAVTFVLATALVQLATARNIPKSNDKGLNDQKNVGTFGGLVG